LLIEMSGRTISVLIGDEQPLFRDALARVVRQRRDLALAGEVTDGHAALVALRQLEPDVAVFGVPLGSMDIRRVIRALTRIGLATRALLLFPYPDPQTMFECLGDGAAGCLTRTIDPHALTRAIDVAAGGRTVVADELQTALAQEIRLRHAAGGPLLTDRECEVLTLVAEGRSNPQIAEYLHVAPSTVKTHVGHLFEKLGVSDRAAAVAVGMRRGLLD
jgi:two-component system nitrate/nitrite response regulator NarL